MLKSIFMVYGLWMLLSTPEVAAKTSGATCGKPPAGAAGSSPDGNLVQADEARHGLIGLRTGILKRGGEA